VIPLVNKQGGGGPPDGHIDMSLICPHRTGVQSASCISVFLLDGALNSVKERVDKMESSTALLSRE
jgi:hypothetical protein